MPPRKIDTLREYMAAGEWERAMALASTFARLGDQKRRIMGAHEAFKRPDFQRQLGRDPAKLIEDGIEALRERYGNPHEQAA